MATVLRALLIFLNRRDSRLDANLIQDAGWKVGQHLMARPIRPACAAVAAGHGGEVQFRLKERRHILGARRIFEPSAYAAVVSVSALCGAGSFGKCPDTASMQRLRASLSEDT